MPQFLLWVLLWDTRKWLSHILKSNLVSQSRRQARNSRPYPSMCFPTHIYCCPINATPLPASSRTPLSQSPAGVPFTSLASWWCSRIPHRLACDCASDQIVFWSTDTDRFPQIFPSPPRRCCAVSPPRRVNIVHWIRSCSARIWSIDGTRARWFGCGMRRVIVISSRKAPGHLTMCSRSTRPFCEQLFTSRKILTKPTCY